jgi:hypothetical protein
MKLNLWDEGLTVAGGFAIVAGGLLVLTGGLLSALVLQHAFLAKVLLLVLMGALAPLAVFLVGYTVIARNL